MKKAWRTWQNWVGVAVGLYAALSPIWTPMGSIAGMALISGGLLIAVAGVFALGTPVVLIMDWVQAALGLALFVSPWVLFFGDELAAAITAWVVGLIALVVGLMITRQVQNAVKQEASTAKPNYDTL